jgi:hypothetical protein
MAAAARGGSVTGGLITITCVILALSVCIALARPRAQQGRRETFARARFTYTPEQWERQEMAAKIQEQAEAEAKARALAQAEAEQDFADIRVGNRGNFCVDVAGISTQAGAKVHMWDCWEGPNQKWAMDDSRRLVSKNSGMCLDVPDGDTRNGAAVQQQSCHDGANQRWRWQGSTLRPDHAPNKCLDVWGGATHNGARLALYDCHGHPNQQFAQPEPREQQEALTTGGKDVVARACVAPGSGHKFSQKFMVANPADTNSCIIADDGLGLVNRDSCTPVPDDRVNDWRNPLGVVPRRLKRAVVNSQKVCLFKLPPVTTISADTAFETSANEAGGLAISGTVTTARLLRTCGEDLVATTNTLTNTKAALATSKAELATVKGDVTRSQAELARVNASAESLRSRTTGCNTELAAYQRAYNQYYAMYVQAADAAATAQRQAAANITAYTNCKRAVI